MTIVCPGHSGSTLLGMCLNSHPNIFAFGEFASLRQRLDDIRTGTKAGLCSFCYEECNLMDDRERRLIKLCYHSRFQRIARLKSVFTHPLYVTRLHRKMKSDVICDTSKSVRWARFLNQYCNWGLALRYIFLYRDPRVVIASHVRKNRDIGTSIEKYRAEINGLLEMRDSLKQRTGNTQIMEISYERFVLNPAEELKKLCDSIGVEFEEAMVDYDQCEHHIVGGNDKARSRVKRKNNQRINYNKVDIAWYIEKKENFFLDERWKTELNEVQKNRIDQQLNDEISRLGYDTGNGEQWSPG